MALRATALLLLLLAVTAAVAESSGRGGSDVTTMGVFIHSTTASASSPTCDGLVGECIDEDEEMEIDSEHTRRGLYARGRYISYGALYRNRVPCNRRGQSYYNCRKNKRVNPYRRGCSAITRCARNRY